MVNYACAFSLSELGKYFELTKIIYICLFKHVTLLFNSWVNKRIVERIKEHDRDIQLLRTQTSAVSEHANMTGNYPL